MNRLAILCIVLMFGATLQAQPPAAGSITGTIRYLGDVPPSHRITATDGQIVVHNDIVVDAKTKGLRDVIVLVDWKEKVAAGAKAKPVTIDQLGMIFIPRVVTVQEGRKVRFENSDNCNHLVDARSILPANTFSSSTPCEHLFKAQKNLIPVGCPLHGWMRAYILVAPHPYHTVTTADGKFKIDGVPAGKHTLQLIHPDTNFRESVTVEVEGGKAAEVTREWKALKK